MPFRSNGDLEHLMLLIQASAYHPHADLDGNRKVDGDDLSIAQLSLFLAPGPSGRRPAP